MRWLRIKVPRDGEWQTQQMTNLGAGRYVIDLPNVPAGPLRVEVEDDQDALDGAAMRRLREALPEGAWYELSTPADGDVEPGLEYSVILWPVRDGNDDWAGVFHEAATIAEAADKCREALG